MFAATKQSGMCVGFPDVCITPVPSPTGTVNTPLPYPNVVNTPMSDDTSEKVYISGSKAVIKKSSFSSSNGDEPGANGGVASGQNLDKVEYLSGSMSVKIEGSDAIKMFSTAKHNSNNTVGTQLVPGQTKVLIMT